MSLRNAMWIVFAVLVYGNIGNVWAYEVSPGGGTSTGGCSAITYSAFMPPQFSQEKNNVEVAPESEFSFLASKATFPESIAVTIKGESVPVTVTPHYGGFQVTGKLPATIKGVFARVNIMGKGPDQCERGDGWLLKVAD